MSLLRLSDECFNTGLDFNFPHDTLYRYDYYVTDGYSLVDTMKININQNRTFIDLKEYQFNSAIKNKISPKNLKRVLNTKNLVDFSDVQLKGFCLAITDKIDTLFNSKYYDSIRSFEVFFYKDDFYFFEFCKAEPEMDIYFNSYMFVGLVRGMEIDDKKYFYYHNDSTLGILKKLKDLHRYYEEQ